MNNWEFIANPPFNVRGSEGTDQSVGWDVLKQQLRPGTVVTGKIFARTIFGVFFDAELGFPVRMNVPDFGKSEGGMIFPDDYPALNSIISGEVAGFDDLHDQVVVVKIGNFLLRKEIGRNMRTNETL